MKGRAESRPPRRPPELAVRPIAFARPSGRYCSKWPFGPSWSVGRPADTVPMKPLRILLIGFVVLVVAGTIASAATGGGHGKPTSPGHTETEAPEPTETEAPEAEATTSDQTGTAPDFSACDGRTGLDNAICRHDALLKVKPDNPGLTNSLAHLQANLAAQAARQAAKAAGTHGNSGTHRNSGSHGPSGS